MFTPFSFNNTEVIKDGLILWYDAADRYSYPTTGTTWRDLSGNNNGVLINNPVFNSGNSGYFQFNGGNQRVNTPITLNERNFTLDAIFQISTLSGWRTLIGQDSDVPGVYGSFYFQKCDATIFSNGTTRLNDRFGFAISSDINSEWFVYDPGNVIPINTWVHYTVSVSPNIITLYKNGIAINSLNNSFTFATVLPTTKVYIGAGVFNNIIGDYWPGRIGVVRIYNRPLTQSEVFQNYVSNRARFNI